MTPAFAPALLFFDPHEEEKHRAKTRPLPDAKVEKDERLFCSTCRHPVTHLNQRIAVGGGHEHRCINPQGIVYRIGCFREASCAADGETTMEYTWFRGYAWRIAYCAQCQAHLGWEFQSDNDCFHGLIVDRLISVGPVKN
ncbi:MAG: hypothetical protein HY274_07520 [Gammaproteobacteria bacterium]|nr:hypothetical protein [Gammaproteobacteria bacterium]